MDVRETGADSSTDDRFTPERLAGLPVSRVTFLCGAGISYAPPAQLPTVLAFIDGAVAHCTQEESIRLAVRAAARSSQDPAPRFEAFVESLGKLGDIASSAGALFDSETPNLLHRFLAGQCGAGAAIVTTNFDNCIERSMCTSRSRIVFSGTDLTEMGPITRAIVKPHGSNPLGAADTESSLVVSIGALGRTAKGFARFPMWRAYLHELFRNRFIVVLGYSGSDDFDMTPVLLESSPERVFWIDYDPGAKMPRPADPSTARRAVQRICSTLPSIYLRGAFDDVARALLRDADGLPATPGVTAAPDKLERWLNSAFATDSARQELLTLILRHYSLHDLTINISSPPLSGASIIERATAFYYRGRYAEACETLRSVGPSVFSPGQECQAAYVLAAALFYSGDLSAARAESLRHVAKAEQLGDIGEVQTALNNAAAIAFSAGDEEDAVARYRRVLQYQQQYPALYAEAMATWGLGDIANRLDQTEEALGLYSRARELCDQLGSRQGIAWMDANLGDLLRRRGDFERSAGYLAEADTLFQELGVAAGLLFTVSCLAKLEYSRDSPEKALDALRRCLNLVAHHRDSPAMTDMLMLAYLLAQDIGAQDVLTEAKSVLRNGLRMRRQSENSGAVADRLEVCRRLLRRKSFNAELYNACRHFVGPDTRAVS